MDFPKLLVYLLLPAFSIIQACSLNNISESNHFDPAGFIFIGQAVLPTGFMFEDTEVGGLSAITYDRDKDIFYAISDDKGYRQPARFYTLKIDLSTGRLNNESVKLTDVTFLRKGNGEVYEPGSVDFEGITLAGGGNVFISSEAANSPMLAKYSKDGRFIKSLPVPEKFLPDKGGTKGIRHNLGFESLTISQDGQLLTTAIENALVQDGPPAASGKKTSCRILTYTLQNGREVSERLYHTDKIVAPGHTPGNAFVSGLVELLSTADDHTYLALERTYSENTGHTIKLFRIDTEGSTDISSIRSLSDTQHRSRLKPVEKQLVIDFNELHIPLDNIEGMTFGPPLPGGSQSLIFVSDNNFNPEQSTRILAFGVSLAE